LNHHCWNPRRVFHVSEGQKARGLEQSGGSVAAQREYEVCLMEY
jgi:hypothetical protein